MKFAFERSTQHVPAAMCAAARSPPCCRRCDAAGGDVHEFGGFAPLSSAITTLGRRQTSDKGHIKGSWKPAVPIAGRRALWPVLPPTVPEGPLVMRSRASQPILFTQACQELACEIVWKECQSPWASLGQCFRANCATNADLPKSGAGGCWPPPRAQLPLLQGLLQGQPLLCIRSAAQPILVAACIRHQQGSAIG